ncbi:MAG: nitrate ABC transporter substrate-binding protein [Rhodobacteraceae bacterium]|jgi:NitT/TauT family transport system substrate-binding protein|nr:nitrate ABC transporter substrate-binding protein [Paracoccaceae bacterium]MBL6855709.1 ABC transporter substrate-binding protein [Paracoccaceae bacterium]MBV03190.1 nitrate ABC transporter substrate-binding protein [Paracoccaceae bacterium]MDG1879163.1 ABC transporter substrate-binding protein [Paracoccaceae bacterium]MDG1939869.1 ABC transporter substrate-binding protein [Paracoccaceae bacterium]|tara:strand:- start:11125 stop:12114 length:990 start_codon:yes stop_codon:yes gene_type:complete
MKKYMIFAVGAIVAITASIVNAADNVTVQLKWVTQTQFAGYYVAQDKGFYEAEGLNVTIKAGGPDIGPMSVLAGGGADVAVDWMPSALAAREQGFANVNIAQPFAGSGMMLVCRKDRGVNSVADLKGKNLYVWYYGNEWPFLSWMNKLGLATDGSDGGVSVFRQGWDILPLTQGDANCVSAMAYNEYWQVLAEGLTPEELTVFKYEDEGVATLEDGLYVKEENLSDPAFVDRMVRFVRASMKGWKYAEANQAEAAQIVVDNDDSGAQTVEHNTIQMGEIAKLTAGSNGALSEADFNRTVSSLMTGGSDPVITKMPSGAWSHVITDQALK